MSRGVVPVNVIGRSGSGLDVTSLSATAGDATNGHSVANNGRVFVSAKNTNAVSTARTVTFKTVKSVDGLTPATDVRSHAAGHEVWYGPFPTDIYGGSLEIDVSHAEMVLKAFRLS
jgi:hypothetical protein